MNLPSSVSIALTTRCNANCVMCWRRVKLGAGRDMSFETYENCKKMLCSFPENTLVFLSTGEPSISPFIKDFLLFCSNLKFKVLLYSNAQKVPDGLGLALQKGLNISFGFSVDGGDNGAVGKIQRGCKFDTMLDTIEAIADIRPKKRPRVSINFIANSDNVYTLKALVDRIKVHTVDKIEVSPMKYFEILQNDTLKESIRQYAKLDLGAYWEEVREICSRKDILFRAYGLDEGHYDYSLVCRFRRKMLVIDVGGNVLPCVGTEHVYLGNINTTSIKDIMMSAKLKAINEGLASGEIADCCKECSLSLKNRNLEYYN